MNFHVSMLYIRRSKRIKLQHFEQNKAKRVRSSRKICSISSQARRPSQVERRRRYPSVGSNFSKPPTLSEIPEIQNPAGWVSSKTQKDTKPIKNWISLCCFVLLNPYRQIPKNAGRIRTLRPSTTDRIKISGTDIQYKSVPVLIFGPVRISLVKERPH